MFHSTFGCFHQANPPPSGWAESISGTGLDDDNDNNNDKDNDKDKDTDKVPEKPNICYIFEILVTYSFQI